MMIQLESNLPYDPRGLLLCTGCATMMPYRTLREGDDAVWKHRKHGGRVMALRSRRPGWRKNGKPVPTFKNGRPRPPEGS